MLQVQLDIINILSISCVKDPDNISAANERDVLGKSSWVDLAELKEPNTSQHK